jgi:peptidyl-prolyl cis-trans isomerase D
MLKQVHKHMSWIMWAIIILITVTFLFFGIYPSSTTGSMVANVNGDVITGDELNRAYRNLYDTYKQIFKDQFNEAMTKTLRTQALRELVQGRLLVQEAGRMGLKISDDELRGAIMKVPAFSPQGKFDQRIYQYYLQRENITPAVFETELREFMLRKKLENLIEDSVDVADAELAAAYAASNPKAKAGDFEKNKESFRKTQLQKKRSEAREAFVRGLESKGKVILNDKALASS